MSSFPGSPKVQKGAIIGMDPFNPMASIVVFQYNPESMTRTLRAQVPPEGARSEAQRLGGPPQETIKLEVEIDATDQLEKADRSVASVGIYPQLSSLEMLLYPKSSLVIANAVLTAMGSIEVIAPDAPLTLFIWGRKRILPVRITEFTITEEAHDVSLNPIRAKVALGLRVLSYNDLMPDHPGYGIFLAHQVVKEAMAIAGSLGNLSTFAGG